MKLLEVHYTDDCSNLSMNIEASLSDLRVIRAALHDRVKKFEELDEQSYQTRLDEVMEFFESLLNIL